MGIISLVGAKPAVVVDEHIVEMLEQYLVQAKRGEIDAIGIAVSRPNNTICHGYNWGEGGGGFRLMAAVSWLDKSVTAAMEKSSGC